MEKQTFLDALYKDISFLKNFKGEMHYSIKHIRRLEKDVILYKDRLQNQYKTFRELAPKHLGISAEEADQIIEINRAEVIDDLT